MKSKKIPKHIVKSMYKAVEHFKIANRAMLDIEEWLEKNGVDPNYLRDVCDGQGLEELEYMNELSIPELVERINEMLREE